LEIVSGEREGEIASTSHDDSDEEVQSEETELLKEIAACITRLFRISSLIRQAAPTDLFAKALSRNRYQFIDQFDIAHVGEKHPKLATEELAWLQKRLGRAITQRRHYLSYIQDHRHKLENPLTHEETPEPTAPKSRNPTEHLPAMTPQLDSSSRPSTFFTKASSLTPGYITPQMLTVEEDSDHNNDAKSYTTISRSVDGDLDTSTTIRIPKLDDLRTGSKKEVECPFCFRVKSFKNERVWRRHVFSDLRSYVCTFPECDAPYFSDINDWFRHEMQIHRVSYTCPFCQGKIFQHKERYLAHVRKQHPDMLEDGEQQAILDIARKPLDQVPAQDCPCCSDWVDRLNERAELAGIPSNTSNHILTVVPTEFKRHLASHLERLALFAIPIDSAPEGDVNSNAAIRKDVDALSEGSDMSILAFDNSRPSSPTRDGQLLDDVLTAGEYVEAVTRADDGGREDMSSLLDQKKAELSTKELSPRPSSREGSPEVEIMDFTVRSDPIIPTYEGFRTHARQLNPRLAVFLVERITQEQMRRYKRLVEYKLKHLHAVKDRNCASGKFCVDLGGAPEQLQPKASNRDSDAPVIYIQSTAVQSSDDNSDHLSERAVVSAHFPAGVPLPPERLPAEFECPLCFRVKKFYKPVDWTKHVHEDVQPFTCTFPNCGEPKSFKRKADWVRHENERHRQLENWTCQIGDCTHTCFRKDNFVQHLVREHRIAEPRQRTVKRNDRNLATTVDMGMQFEISPRITANKSLDDIWNIVEKCRRDTTKLPQDEPCRFCGHISKTWKKLTVHLAKHMEQISMPILPLVEQKVFPDDLPPSIADLRTVGPMNYDTEMHDAWQGGSNFLPEPILAVSRDSNVSTDGPYLSHQDKPYRKGKHPRDDEFQ
jgi:hypothetical protein